MKKVLLPSEVPTWEDDEPDNATFPYITKKWGYNDLERRKISLCLLLNTACSITTGTIATSTFDLMRTIGFTPFPYASH